MRGLFLALTLLLCACSRTEPLYHTQNYIFGTLVDVSIDGESDERAQAATQEIVHTFQALNRRLHAWQASEITAINAAFASGKVAPVQPDVARMIEQATVLSEQSQGKFNPAIGKLIALWGFQHDEFKAVAVNESDIKTLLAAHPQMRNIHVKDGMVASDNPAVQLDLGGYAKGYALDVALQILKKRDIKNALINIGGNIIALGQHGEQAWRVGIQHPRKPMAMATIDLASGWAIGTSGDYQRYFELNGKRYCHVIDPSTGYPVQGVQSVTVLIPPSAQAGSLSDVASKPIFIAAPQARSAAAQSMAVQDYLIIESTKHLKASASMAKKLHWLDHDAKAHLTIVSP